MRPTRERGWLGTAASCLAWALVVSAVAYPIYGAFAEEHQAHVLRFAAALILGVVLLQIRKRVRSDLETQPPSRFDPASKARTRPVKIDPQFAQLTSEVQHSLKSRRYFDHVLWPRLLALAERQGSTLNPPPPRWPATRGPSVRAIADLVSTLERKP